MPRCRSIAYDQGTGAFAARLWWLLRWLGHRQVAVLNGGFAAWERAALPVSSADAAYAARGSSRAAPDRPHAGEHRGSIAPPSTPGRSASGALMLVDARSAERFAGENETIDPVAGHIPGARNHPFARNHDAQGRFLAAGELRAAWQHTLRGARSAAS